MLFEEKNCSPCIFHADIHKKRHQNKKEPNIEVSSLRPNQYISQACTIESIQNLNFKLGIQTKVQLT